MANDTNTGTAAPQVVTVEMGHGNVAVGTCTRATDGVPGIIYLQIPGAARVHASDCADLYPVGSAAPADRMLACIHFATAETVQQSIDVLREIQAAHYPAAPQDERALFERSMELDAQAAGSEVTFSRHDDGTYRAAAIQSAWHGWQARAALPAQAVAGYVATNKQESNAILDRIVSEPQAVPPASILEPLFRPLAGRDKNQWGYTHSEGWNDALRAAMDVIRANAPIAAQPAAQPSAQPTDAQNAARYLFLRDNDEWHQSDRYWEAISSGGQELDDTIDKALEDLAQEGAAS